jgi:hypothetical protein
MAGFLAGCAWWMVGLAGWAGLLGLVAGFGGKMAGIPGWLTIWLVLVSAG